MQCGENELQKQNQHNTRLNTNCNNSAVASPSSAPASNNLFMCFPLEIYKVQQQSRHVFRILRTTVIEIIFFFHLILKRKKLRHPFLSHGVLYVIPVPLCVRLTRAICV